MKIERKEVEGRGVKFLVKDKGKEIARAYLYVLKNELHKDHFGLMEDVFVDEKYRAQGIGTMLVKEIIKEARKSSCYKLIATSRHERDQVHELYKKLGFKDQGKEFRIDF